MPTPIPRNLRPLTNHLSLEVMHYSEDNGVCLKREKENAQK